MPDFYTGLIEGFQGRREAEYTRNVEKERQDRAMADRVFNYLLASRDPKIQELALAGLMAPSGGRKKGFSGWMGEVESNPVLAQIVSVMNEQVPDTSAPTPTTPTPAMGQSAAMSTNVPVEPNNAPPAIPSMDFGSEAARANQLANSAEAGGTPGFSEEIGVSAQAPPAIGMPPPGPPPESKWKRRGTGVPTAEEIAEMNARVPLQAKLQTARLLLQQAGATPQEVQDAMMGILGAPRNQRMLSAVTQWGVKLPGSETVVPVLLDQNQGYVTAGGQALPPGAQMVRMSGGASGGGVTTTIRDSPEIRAQYGIDSADKTPSGYWKIKQFADGSVTVLPSEYNAPPAYSGTTEIADPNNPEVPVRVPILRSGGIGGTLGDAPGLVDSTTAEQAKALKKAVDDAIKLQQQSTLGRIRGVTPAQRDAIVQQKARESGLPYQNYDSVVRAAEATPQVTPRTRATGGSVAERVRQRALQNRQEQGLAPPAAPRTPTRPPVPGGRQNPVGPRGGGR